MAVKYRVPKHVRQGATADAVRYAVRQGLAPEELLAVPLGTINRIAREVNWRETARRQNRFEAAYANQVHQFDASHSEHFIPVKKVGGEWVLKLRPRRQKNKEKAEKVKVIAYGLTDDMSGYRLSRYLVAPGESAAGGISFLQWAWAKEAAHAPFRGLPEILYMDNGPLARKAAFREFAKRVGVAVETHEPERAEATGKVEANWRAMWKRFETPWFFDPNWGKREIALSELNQELAAFWRDWNKKLHRRLNLTREEAWLTVMSRGGVVDIDPSAWRTIFHRESRRVDAAGCFDFRGTAWQVREIHACEVWVYQGVVDGALLVEDRRDGRRYQPQPFVPKVWGEYRGSPKTDLEKLLEEDRGRQAEVAWQPPTWREDHRQDACATGKVVHLVRAGEVRESGFKIPPSPPLEKGGESLEELARGAEVVPSSESRVPSPELFATPLERYAVLKVRELAGERLAPEEAQFLREIETEYAEPVRLMRNSLESRARLAAVEG
jgi:hypothetical protein